MCLPALGVIGAVASLAGSAVSAMGASQQADAQANQMEYNATVAKINARSERQKGYVEQEKIIDKYERQMSTAQAAAGASGVDPYFGSAALVIFGENAENRALDRNNAYVSAEGAAVAHENKARDLEAQAAATRKGGKMAAAGTFLSGIAGAVGGLGKAGGGGGGTFGVPQTVYGGEGW